MHWIVTTAIDTLQALTSDSSRFARKRASHVPVPSQEQTFHLMIGNSCGTSHDKGAGFYMWPHDHFVSFCWEQRIEKRTSRKYLPREVARRNLRRKTIILTLAWSSALDWGEEKWIDQYQMSSTKNLSAIYTFSSNDSHRQEDLWCLESTRVVDTARMLKNTFNLPRQWSGRTWWGTALQYHCWHHEQHVCWRLLKCYMGCDGHKHLPEFMKCMKLVRKIPSMPCQAFMLLNFQSTSRRMECVTWYKRR